MSIQVSLTKLSEQPHSRACVICGSAKMTNSYQLGMSKYAIELDDKCLAVISVVPGSPVVGDRVPLEVTAPPKSSKKESRGGSK